MKRRDHFHAIDRKQYDARRFKNPYVQRVAKRPWKPIVALVLTFGLLIAGGAYVLTSDRFDYTDVTVEGMETIPPADVIAIADAYLHRSAALISERRNRFLFREKDLESALRESFAFDELRIETNDRSIHIAVKEKTSQLLWESGDALYLVALDGIVTRLLTAEERAILDAPPVVVVLNEADQPVPPVEGVPEAAPIEPPPPPEPVLVNPLTRMPVVTDTNDTAVVVGSLVMTPEEIQNLFAFHERLNEQGIGIRETQIDRTAGKWVAVKTDLGYAILFDLTGNMDEQAVHLRTILAESVPDPSKLEYVDLRFDDHVYYKLR